MKLNAYIRGKILDYSHAFAGNSFYVVWVAEAYGLDWLTVRDECRRMVDVGLLGMHRNGRFYRTLP